LILRPLDALARAEGPSIPVDIGIDQRSTTMVATDKVFAGSIPELYDQYLVPLIFETYASDLATRIARTAPQDVLETAAGTGVLTTAMVARLPTSARIVATDLNQPMLDYSSAKPSLRGRVTWQQADAQALPFEDATFDVVTCQFGAMFFPDKVKGYSEARRVLKPRGRFLFNVWGRISDNHFAQVVTDSLIVLFPQDPPLFLARTPHGYHDVARIREDVSAAGFPDVAIDTIDFTSKAASARDVAIAYCQGTPLRNEIVARNPSGLEEATNLATAALAKRFGDGAIEGMISAHVVTATT
jgi:ubiquinone/menaquinone biosynthesis C-methylase UbiE